MLPAFGIGWVVVYPDDPAARDLDLTGLHQVYASPEVRLYAVPAGRGLDVPEPDALGGGSRSPWPTLLALLTVLGAAVVRLSAWRSRRGRRPGARRGC